MLRLECTYRGCTVHGVRKALEDMLENGAPELAEYKVTVVNKSYSKQPAGMLPAGSLVETVYQEMAPMAPFMSPRDSLLRFGMGFIDPPEGSQANKGSKVLFDVQTSCLSDDYPCKQGLVRTNQAKVTTYVQRGQNVYSIEFMYMEMGGWMPSWLVSKGMAYEMPSIIQKLTKKYASN